MSLQTLPGQTALTVIPWPASSRASPRVSETTAAFEAEYAVKSGAGERATHDATFTILPARRSAIGGATAWIA